METIKKEILRGGQFLVKETKCEDVFTPEDFSEEQIMMKDAVKEFTDREIVANRDRFEAKDYALTEEVMKKAGELGFLGVAVPEEYGGMGMGFVSTMITCEYISSGNGSLSTAFGAHTGIGTMPITLYGTEEQKQKYGQHLVQFLHTSLPFHIFLACCAFAFHQITVLIVLHQYNLKDDLSAIAPPFTLMISAI